MNVNEINFLIVEDDEFQRQIMKDMLVQLGARLIWDVNNGKIALDKIRNKQNGIIDLIICDLNMPEMDGLEFLRHLGKERQNVSIILLSAFGNNLLASAGKIAKLHGIKLLGTIDKPIMSAQLECLISKYSPVKSKFHEPIKSQTFSIEEILEGIKEKQFEPFFQPKVNFHSGQIIGAETLARWIHPKFGIIPPYSFISVLESSSNIDELTYLILEKSAEAFHTFRKMNDNLTLSINLSADSLDKTGFAESVTKIVRNTGLNTQNFILEITESAAMTDVANALENLARLSMNGFELSIDDYGTGFSSMQQLTRVSFSELKIDQSFVRDFTENKNLRIMVKSCIDMAHKLNIKCVAEGVETKEEWELLKSMNCDVAQGYFIARPLSFEKCIDFFRLHLP
jgi:EAL domain-containing protein (putative c-di-GMP-specific phosphodiesterase class I)/FixJ family two-component response regulator